jgi:hypothetical protein
VSTSPSPWLIGLLVAVAAATLAVGVGLEGTSWVDRYPFQVNVLSEIAGLAVATLATLLFLNKAVEDWNARRWRSAKESAVVSAVYDARHLAGWLAELHGVGDAPDELEPMGQIGFDRLVAELRETRNRLQGVRSAARFFRDPWLAGHPGHHGRSSANRPFSEAVEAYSARARLWAGEYLAHLVDTVLPALEQIDPDPVVTGTRATLSSAAARWSAYGKELDQLLDDLTASELCDRPIRAPEDLVSPAVLIEADRADEYRDAQVAMSHLLEAQVYLGVWVLGTLETLFRRRLRDDLERLDREGLRRVLDELVFMDSRPAGEQR